MTMAEPAPDARRLTPNRGQPSRTTGAPMHQDAFDKGLKTRREGLGR